MKKRSLVFAMMLVLVFGMTACGQKSEGVLTFIVPQGFEYDEDYLCYLGPDYPNELANINYYSYENDGTFGAITKVNIERELEAGLSEGFGTDVDITLTRWDKTKVNGYDGIIYAYEYTCGGIGYEQIQVAIEGKDNYHYITFSDYADSAYTDAFEECIKSMAFVAE